MTRSPATEKLARRIAERARQLSVTRLGTHELLRMLERGDFDDLLVGAAVSECAGCGEPDALCENCRLDAARKARLEGNE